MPTYRYVAKDSAGKTAAGILEAESEQAAGRALRDQGLWPLRVVPAKGRVAAPDMVVPAAPAGPGVALRAPGPAAAPGRGERGVSPLDLSVFFHHLATAVHSGMPLARCMEIMAQQSRGPLSRISLEAQAAVNRGLPISTAFVRHPRVFSPTALAMVRAGEKGGFLDTALQRIAEVLERQHQLRQTIRRETAYPKLVVGAALVIPVAVRLIVGSIAGSSAPGGVSGFGSAIWSTVVPLFLLIAAVVLVNRFAAGAPWLDRMKLQIPLVGRVVRHVAVAQFSRSLASLYRAGVPYPEAVGTAADACGNAFLAERLRRALPAVQRGERLSVALGPSHPLTPMAMNMLITGEETGDLDAMLDKVADYAEGEAGTSIKVMTSMLTPLLILLIGIAVAVEVLRFYTGLFGSHLTLPE
ncbi:MAG: type II secretion system F family protein [Armatimonadetes bacterium]|nr:type II secretion system F family protein [Armatimonadota bacterium]